MQAAGDARREQASTSSFVAMMNVMANQQATMMQMMQAQQQQQMQQLTQLLGARAPDPMSQYIQLLMTREIARSSQPAEATEDTAA